MMNQLNNSWLYINLEKCILNYIIIHNTSIVSNRSMIRDVIHALDINITPTHTDLTLTFKIDS